MKAEEIMDNTQLNDNIEIELDEIKEEIELEFELDESDLFNTENDNNNIIPEDEETELYINRKLH